MKTVSKSSCARKNIRKNVVVAERACRVKKDFIKMEEITAISFADRTDEGAKKRRLEREFVDL